MEFNIDKSVTKIIEKSLCHLVTNTTENEMCC